MTAHEFCVELLRRGDLSDKLRPPRTVEGRLLPVEKLADGARLVLAEGEPPARAPGLRMRSGGERLPPLSALKDHAARVACLRRFAHHELLAIELFAWAVAALPELPPGLVRGFLLTLEEEQRHLRLYLDRLAAHGAGLDASSDDGALSDYLWQARPAIERAADPLLAFLCTMGLTFEQANLDFTMLYRDAFQRAGDDETARALAEVHSDEIRHVRLAARWLRLRKQPTESEIEAYRRGIPFPLSAARAKGRRFERAARQRAGLSEDFIAYVQAAQPYTDEQSARAAAEPRPAFSPSRNRQPAARLLLPNLGAEESDRPVPASARGFLRGLYGAWAALFGTTDGAVTLLPPGEDRLRRAFREALGDTAAVQAAALPGLDEQRGLIAWLPTAGAAAAAARLGQPLAGPGCEVVRAVHEKGFAAETAQALGLVPACLRGLSLTLDEEACRSPLAMAGLHERLADWPAWVDRIVIKPRLSTSGRGHHVFARRSPGVEPALLQALSRRGGAVVEPWLRRERDLSVQLSIGRSGVEILGTTTQLVTASGRILGNRGVLAPTSATSSELRSGAGADCEAAMTGAARRLGEAAAAAGYFGIAGVDAFTFYDTHDRLTLRPIVELNARFTTGTVALGLVRLYERSQGPGARPLAWALLLKSQGLPLAELAAAAVRVVCPVAGGPALLIADTEAALTLALSQLFSSVGAGS